MISCFTDNFDKKCLKIIKYENDYLKISFMLKIKGSTTFLTNFDIRNKLQSHCFQF